MGFGVVPKTTKIKIPPVNGQWNFPEPMGINKVGFVYVIRDLVLKRGYIGKKFYRRQGLLKGGEEYDWRNYKSSSNTMFQLMSARPPEEFDFICIEEYATKSGLSYAETWSLCYVEAPTTPLWYNTRIEKIAWSVREAITFRHRERLAMVQEWKEIGKGIK